MGVVMGRIYRRLTDRCPTAVAEGIEARSERQVSRPTMRESAAVASTVPEGSVRDVTTSRTTRFGV